MDLISCVCPTMVGRECFLARTVACFQHQTYPHKELVFVTEEENLDAVHAACAPLPVDQVRIVAHELRLTVGEKRNCGTAAAHGKYIAVCDDDDYYGPNRLWRQHEFLMQHRSQVTVLGQTYLTNSDQSLWWLSHRGWIDSSLFYARDFWGRYQFSALNMGQDAEFIRAAAAESVFAVGGDPRLMYITNHSGNTCDRSCLYGPNTALKNFVWHDC